MQIGSLFPHVPEMTVDRPGEKAAESGISSAKGNCRSPGGEYQLSGQRRSVNSATGAALIWSVSEIWRLQRASRGFVIASRDQMECFLRQAEFPT